MTPLQCLSHRLTKLMGALGANVAREPKFYFTLGLCILLSLSLPGFHKLEYITDNERLFVPHDSPGVQVNTSLKSLPVETVCIFAH